MTWDAIGGALIGGAVTVVASWIVIVQTNHQRALDDAQWHGKMTMMVSALWIRVFSNAVVEGMSIGWLEKNSPIRTTPNAFSQHPKLVEDLQSFYEQEGKNLNDLELLVAVERRFAKELLELETAHEVKNGAALAAACYLVRPGMELYDPSK